MAVASLRAYAASLLDLPPAAELGERALRPGAVGGPLGVLRRSGAGEGVGVRLVSSGGCCASEYVRLQYLFTTTRGVSSVSSCLEAMHAGLMYYSYASVAVSCEGFACVLSWCRAMAM